MLSNPITHIRSGGKWFPKYEDTKETYKNGREYTSKVWSHAFFRHTVGRIDALFQATIVRPLAFGFQALKIAVKFVPAILPIGVWIGGPNWTPAGLSRDLAVLVGYGREWVKSVYHIVAAPSMNSSHTGRAIKKVFFDVFYGSDFKKNGVEKDINYRGYHYMPAKFVWKQRALGLSVEPDDKLKSLFTLKLREGVKFGWSAFKRYYLATDKYYGR